MNHSAVAEWLNSAFSKFDYSLLFSLHNFAEKNKRNFNRYFYNCRLNAGEGFTAAICRYHPVLYKKNKKTRILSFCCSMQQLIHNCNSQRAHCPLETVYRYCRYASQLVAVYRFSGRIGILISFGTCNGSNGYSNGLVYDNK